MEEKELYESFWLCTIKGIGTKSVERLLEAAGCVEEVKNLPSSKVAACIGQARAEIFTAAVSQKERHKVADQLLRMQEKNITFLPRWAKRFPHRLRKIPDPPLMIFVKGKLPDEKQRQAALIGARACSAYGAQMARYFSEQLACAGIGIISGMARGIDSIAQETALYTGHPSTAVLGCGVDICYPPENRRLYERLEREGCLISEYLPGTQPKAHMFPQRNRIISGMSDLVLVIEAREKSGTLITVDMALEQGKEVFAVPGRVQDMCSQGCNRLIANGAGMAMDADSVLDAFGRLYTAENWFCHNDKGGNEFGSRKMSGDTAISLTGPKRPLTEKTLSALGSDACSLDLLAERIPEADSLPELMQELLALKMEGIVDVKGGSYFRR